MKPELIFIPVLIQIALTIGLYIQLIVVKSRAVQKRQVNEERRALHDDAWPDSVLKVNNCIRNQFETPVLFYVLILTFWVTDSISFPVHVMAWIFVVSRFVHAYVHTGTNYVPVRRKIFMFSSMIVVMLGAFAATSIFF